MKFLFFMIKLCSAALSPPGGRPEASPILNIMTIVEIFVLAFGRKEPPDVNMFTIKNLEFYRKHIVCIIDERLFPKAAPPIGQIMIQRREQRKRKTVGLQAGLRHLSLSCSLFFDIFS